MEILHIILPLALGALIGYVTNYIAVKMLFRPYSAVKTGSRTLPFTPGVIPKNKSRIAITPWRGQDSAERQRLGLGL